MAHQGRAYPLTQYRGMNADAPYPYWAPRWYTIALPTAAGILAPYLSQRVFQLVPAQWIDGRLFYEATVVIPEELTQVWARLTIDWINDPTDSRLVNFRLDFFQTLPIGAGTMAEFNRLYPNTTRMDDWSGPATFVLNAIAYNPLDDYHAVAQPWF